MTSRLQNLLLAVVLAAFSINVTACGEVDTPSTDTNVADVGTDTVDATVDTTTPDLTYTEYAGICESADLEPLSEADYEAWLRGEKDGETFLMAGTSPEVPCNEKEDIIDPDERCEELYPIVHYIWSCEGTDIQEDDTFYIQANEDGTCALWWDGTRQDDALWEYQGEDSMTIFICEDGCARECTGTMI